MHIGRKFTNFFEKAKKASPDNAAMPGSMDLPGTLSPGMNSIKNRPDLKAFMRSCGRRVGSNLREAFNSLKLQDASKTTHSTQSNVADLLRQSHKDSYAKFRSNEAGVNKAMALWACGSETLTHLLKPYINPGNKKAGTPQTDGLRSGVTTLLNGIYKEGSRAPQQLQDAARALSSTPIFKVLQEDGTSRDITLMNFATPGDHGTGMLDRLNIPPEQRIEIAQRITLALAELGSIGDAYINNRTSLPARQLNSADCVLVSAQASQGTKLKGPDAIPGSAWQTARSEPPDISPASIAVRQRAPGRTDGRLRPSGPRAMPNSKSAPVKPLNSAVYAPVSSAPQGTDSKKHDAIQETTSAAAPSGQADIVLASTAVQQRAPGRTDRPPKPSGPRKMPKSKS